MRRITHMKLILPTWPRRILGVVFNTPIYNNQVIKLQLV